MTEILEQLSKGPVLGDGGYVVILKEQGVPMEKYTPHGILTHGHLVRALYQGFLDAGAEVITAQTFHGSRGRLRRTGNEDQFEEIHRVAVEMAREVAGDKALVAGSVTSAIGFDRSLATLEESYADCKEESELMITLGVDFLILEGFWFLDEARTALKAAVEAVGSKDKAVLVTLPFRYRETIDGHAPDECARVLRNEGADIIGVHCERDPENMYPVIEPMQQAVDVPIAMQPIAIRCAPSDYWNRANGFWTGRALPPEAMADYARAFPPGAGPGKKDQGIGGLRRVPRSSLWHSYMNDKHRVHASKISFVLQIPHTVPGLQSEIPPSPGTNSPWLSPCWS